MKRQTVESSDLASVNEHRDILKSPQVLQGLIQSHLNAVVQFGSIVLRGCFALNAIVGVAAFAQQAQGAKSLILCAIGAICSIAAAALAWGAQKCHMAADFSDWRNYPANPRAGGKYRSAALWLIWACAILCAASVVLFACAFYLIYPAQPPGR